MLDSTRKQYPMSKSKGEVQQDDRRGAIVVKIKSQTCREAWRAQQTLVCTRTEGKEQQPPQETETEQCLSVSEEVQVSNSLLQGQGLWVQ